MKNILIYGASGHAKMIVDIIHKTNNYDMRGFVDCYKPINEDVYGYKVVGNLEDIPKLVKELNIQCIAMGIGENFTRMKKYHQIKEVAPDIEFVSIIHPTATIAQDVSVTEGTVIMANVVVNANAKIGKVCILNTASTLGHDCIMDDFSSLASGVTVAGGVQIGLCSAICLGARIIQNLTIGDHTVVGAGSIVLKSIGSNKKAFGAPINVIKERSPDSKYLG